MDSAQKLTPAMAQYYDIKSKYKDSVLFFRMGDFYEMFDDDAQIAHKVLGISLTSRNKNAENPIPLAGIPYHATEKYLPILVNAGYKVAICEQVSDPKAKGIVQRDVVRVVTPATLSLEGDNYESRDNADNIIASISENKLGYGISYIDMNSSRWKTGEFKRFEDLATELYKMSPKEVILDKNLFNNVDIKDILSKKFSLNIYFFEFEGDSKEKLKNHFGTKSLEPFYIENKPLAQKSSALLLSYLELNQKNNLSFLNSISFERFDEFIGIDENTVKNLDLIYNFSTKSQTLGTLFGVLNDTKTPMGARKLKLDIVKPLQDPDKIKGRLDIIEEFKSSPILLDKVQEKLKQVSDIDLILNRLHLGRAMPRDLLNLKRSLMAIVEAFEIIKESGNKKLIKLLKID